MSVTIGIGYASKRAEDFEKQIAELGLEFGYGIARGVSSAEGDVRRGIEKAKIISEWTGVLTIRSPENAQANLAFGIHRDELLPGKPLVDPPKFFRFLKQVDRIAAHSCSKLAIFFAGEWHDKDKVRVSYGTISHLLILLSLPGSWCGLVGTTVGVQEGSWPLLFDVRRKKECCGNEELLAWQGFKLIPE